MKRFKLGIAAVVALVAMSFTLVSNESSKNFSLADGCWSSIAFSGTLPAAQNPSADIEDITDFNVSSATGGTQLTPSVDLNDINDECPGNQVLCCYRVVDNKITHIAYKSAQ